MKTLNKVVSLVVLLGALCAVSAAQTSLIQTTLAADQGVGPTTSSPGITTPFQTTVSLASATGITQAFNGAPVTFVYVDQELEAIQTLATGQTTIFNVLRAQSGTKASAHKSGTMVLVQTLSPQFGGQSGSGGFQQADPPSGGSCLSTAVLATPWVNIITAEQWLCSSITGTWVPGWQNRLIPGFAKVTAAVASAAGAILPSGPLFHVTGTAAITGFTIPVGFNATALGGGCFTVIPDAVFTYTAAGNIGLASTGLNAGTAVVVVNQPITFCWDATNSKFLPNTQ